MSRSANQCPLYPRKRTSVERSGMSALCQKRTSVRLATASYPCRYTSLFRMRRPQVWKLLENVGVRLEARGRTLIFRQEGQTVIDHIVSEDPAVWILCRFRW